MVGYKNMIKQLDACVMKLHHLGHLQLLSRDLLPSTVVAEMKVSPEDEMANPQCMKVFTVERHGLAEDLVSFKEKSECT